jgi:adenylate cyclase
MQRAVPAGLAGAEAMLMDAQPRKYPDFVTVVDYSERGRSSAPAETDLTETQLWLLRDANKEPNLLLLFESLIWRLVASGVPLVRVSLHIGTLHPQLIGFAWNWNIADGIADEVKIEVGVLQSSAYRLNPLYRVMEFRETVRCSPQDPEAAARFPLIRELAELGVTDYLVRPLNTAGPLPNAISMSTDSAEGFSADQLVDVDLVLDLFALQIERHIGERIARNVLDTYVGRVVGTRVLQGEIRRGSGDSIRAVVWNSDLRKFTDLSERLSGPEMTAVLNSYFEALVGAVIAHGGEVLKFMGDGLLAVFPYAEEGDAGQAAAAAIAAARDGLERVEELNAAPPEALDNVPGWRPLRSGIAIHLGDVFFGNVGSPERLDFTVIGPAVNVASRVEALTKETGYPILITAPVARLLERPLQEVGEYMLRGVKEPMQLFVPSAQ